MRWAPPLPGHHPLLALGLADGSVQLVTPPPPPHTPSDTPSSAATLALGHGLQDEVAQAEPPEREVSRANSFHSGETIPNGEAPSDSAEGWKAEGAVDVKHGMVLTVDWARHAGRQGQAVASTSSGHLAVVQVRALHSLWFTNLTPCLYAELCIRTAGGCKSALTMYSIALAPVCPCGSNATAGTGTHRTTWYVPGWGRPPRRSCEWSDAGTATTWRPGALPPIATRLAAPPSTKILSAQ